MVAKILQAPHVSLVFSWSTEAVIKTSQWRNKQRMTYEVGSPRSYHVRRSVGRGLWYELPNSHIFSVVMILSLPCGPDFLLWAFTCWLNSLSLLLSLISSTDVPSLSTAQPHPLMQFPTGKFSLLAVFPCPRHLLYLTSALVLFLVCHS